MKTTIILMSALAMTSMHAAVLQNLTLYDGDQMAGSAPFTVSTVADGNDLLYTITGTGDLDGLGLVDDTFTAVLRLSAVSGSDYGVTVTDELTLGVTDVTNLDPAAVNRIGKAQADTETFIFSIDSTTYTRGEGYTNDVTFNGFDEITTYGSETGQQGYTGTGASAVAWSGARGTNIDLGGVQTAYLTNIGGAGTQTYRLLDFSFDLDNSTVAVPEPSSMALLGFGAITLIARRRR
ncbi:PEP-CTERM sorting domain-containing protein [Rubritalea spongiae]|uniref:PEP-CTERM sorting domain-containing protein n=1 Tax=Rubritalea spongiae TaxID=430797 RepID=A0ABW5E714_9BACT